MGHPVYNETAHSPLNTQSFAPVPVLLVNTSVAKTTVFSLSASQPSHQQRYIVANPTGFGPSSLRIIIEIHIRHSYRPSEREYYAVPRAAEFSELPRLPRSRRWQVLNVSRFPGFVIPGSEGCQAPRAVRFTGLLVSQGCEIPRVTAPSAGFHQGRDIPLKKN